MTELSICNEDLRGTIPHAIGYMNALQQLELEAIGQERKKST